MDRSHLYKHATDTVEQLRFRIQKKQTDLRREKRKKILSLKRLRYGENLNGDESVLSTVEDVILMTRRLFEHNTQRLEILRKLKNIFAQGDTVSDAFLSQNGAIEVLVKHLTGKEVQLQVEAAWCLTNLAASTHKHAVQIAKICGAYLITYLQSSNVILQDLCAWTVGNLAGDCEECRCIMIDQGAVHSLVKLLKSTFHNVVHSAVFALNNLTRGNNKNVFDEMIRYNTGHILLGLVKNCARSDEVLVELATLVMYFTTNQIGVEHITSCGITVTFLIESIARFGLVDNCVHIATPFIRALGNMCAISNQLCDEAAKDNVIFKVMPTLLTSNIYHIKKESLWLLSNVTAGSTSSIKSFVEINLLDVVLAMLDESFDIPKEAAMVLLNISCRTPEYLQQITKSGGLHKFVILTKRGDNDLCLLALQFVELVLRRLNNGQEMFESMGGVEVLDNLYYSGNEEISRCANDLMKVYFELEQSS
ncbi:importin subunit alpha-9-like isoform X2 [Xenia sp. Carnegie-2017]|uniref:importin subunit alpha-9-like isoform X2 n=1 Tax=Xenia sp. Carnegie-2017 TaxID=2897299 RepID=UPI001F03AC83|nr:importin subunit alpha-9-like isoform X2 [Xenia sp. Carnegie-2017]